MAFIFTCGTHTFRSLVAGQENATVQCQKCGNFSGKITKQWDWFTFCFVPVIPLQMKAWQQVHCHICNFSQDIKYRPDVQQMIDGGSGQPIPLQNAPHGAPQGWNNPQGQAPQYHQGKPPEGPYQMSPATQGEQPAYK